MWEAIKATTKTRDCNQVVFADQCMDGCDPRFYKGTEQSQSIPFSFLDLLMCLNRLFFTLSFSWWAVRSRQKPNRLVGGKRHGVTRKLATRTQLLWGVDNGKSSHIFRANYYFRQVKRDLLSQWEHFLRYRPATIENSQIGVSRIESSRIIPNAQRNSYIMCNRHEVYPRPKSGSTASFCSRPWQFSPFMPPFGLFTPV